MKKVDKNDLIVITGAGGFIGGHLARDLSSAGYSKIRCVDAKPAEGWNHVLPGTENLVLDLSNKSACLEALRGARAVFNLAADMGGMGFIENNKALCDRNYISIEPGVSWEFERDWFLSGSYRFRTQELGNESRAYSNAVFVTVSHRFPKWSFVD